MGMLLMADKKKGSDKKGQSTPKTDSDLIKDTDSLEQDEESKEPQTSTRIFTVDQERLKKLSALRGETIAVTFRKLFAKQLRNALIAAAELEANQPSEQQDET
jgi:hypothetical protein